MNNNILPGEKYLQILQKGSVFMNDNRDDINTAEIGAKVKKYVLMLGACMLIFSVLALVVTKDEDEPESILHTTVTTSVMEAQAELDNVPDTRYYETIVVPATQVTTAGNEEIAETTSAENSAPASYSLPLGTDIGKDYSRGVPVYNEVMADWRTHDGVDFNGETGDGVRAIADGIIRDIYTDPIMGDVVTVDHGGGVVADYCGVTAVETVKKGVIVSRSQKIGEISSVPGESDAEFPHLHLEIRVNGELCDPLEVMGFYE